MMLHAYIKALALTVWDKKIFKVFSFGCHGNQVLHGIQIFAVV